MTSVRAAINRQRPAAGLVAVAPAVCARVVVTAASISRARAHPGHPVGMKCRTESVRGLPSAPIDRRCRMPADFWQIFFLFLIFLPLVMLWAFALVDLFKRHDMSGGS